MYDRRPTWTFHDVKAARKGTNNVNDLDRWWRSEVISLQTRRLGVKCRSTEAWQANVLVHKFVDSRNIRDFLSILTLTVMYVKPRENRRGSIVKLTLKIRPSDGLSIVC